MPIRLVCPACSAALSVRDEFAGRAVKCPKCGGVIPATEPAAPSETQPATASNPPPLPPQEPNESAEPAKSGPKITGRPVARTTKADDDADRPRRKEREDEEDEDRGPKSKQDEQATEDRPSKKANRREEEEGEERPARSRRRRDEDDDDRPARGKKQGGGAGIIIAVVCGVLLLCCGGVGLTIYYVVYSVKKGAEEFVENLQPKNDKVTSANFQKLKLLMTRSEVEAILGSGRPTTSSEIQLVFAGHPSGNQYLLVWQRKVARGEVFVWQNREDYLFVAFHKKSAGKLQLKAFLPKNGNAEFSGMGDDEQFARMAQEEGPNVQPIGPPVKQPGEPPVGGMKDEEPPPGPLTEVTAEDLAQAYKDNEAAANTKYKDKWLLVEGKVLDVTSGTVDFATKAETTLVKLVGIKLPGNRGDFAVWGYLHADAAFGGWKLTRGQTVKLKGKCTGGSVLNTFIDLKHCRIESFGPDPSLNATAAGLVAEFLKNADAANEKYRDKEVTISSAVLESISGDLAIFTPTSKKGKIKLQVRFTGTPLKTLQELKPGSRVRFKARCGGLFGDKIANYDAYLVP